MKRSACISFLLLFIVLCGFSQTIDQRYPLIPKPVQLTAADGFYRLDRSTVLIARNQELKSVADTLAIRLSKLTNLKIRVGGKAKTHTISFRLDPSIENPEAYSIGIFQDSILISSAGPAGAFYAVQSLEQLIQPLLLQENLAGKPGYIIPCCRIEDQPAFEWRGFHLDVSRHFFSKEYILKIIDWISSYKINKLHLHLTDDQGWRLQLAAYPLLTEVGAWRTYNELDSACMKMAASNPDFNIDPRFIKTSKGEQKYGGFYSRKEIISIIAYAKAHFIEVIPEIDMPGHMSAAIRAYPYLSCTGAIGWGKEFSYPICPSKEEVLKFSYGVWDEIADIFPSSYVHIGSDEVEKDTWESSSACQEFMKTHSMMDVKEIQNYFVRKLQEHLESKGKKVIAWDDVIDGKVDNKLVMMYWRDWVKDSPARCVENGNKIILTPWSPFYISGKHTDDTFRELYEYDPQDLYPASIMENVMGLQSCVWTEEIPSEDRFEYLVFPRLQALSEVCWSQGRNWEGFQQRLEPHLLRMSSENIHFRKPGSDK